MPDFGIFENCMAISPYWCHGTLNMFPHPVPHPPIGFSMLWEEFWYQIIQFLIDIFKLFSNPARGVGFLTAATKIANWFIEQLLEQGGHYCPLPPMESKTNKPENGQRGGPLSECPLPINAISSYSKIYLKSVFCEIQVRTWVQVVFCHKSGL